MFHSTPIYETAQDRANERHVIEDYLAVCGRPGWTYMKMKPLDAADFAIVGDGGQVLHFVEVKRRMYNFADFEDAMVGLNKVMYAAQAYYTCQMDTYYALRFNDCLAVCNLNVAANNVRWFERQDRPGEGAPHIFIPKSAFEIRKEY